MMRIYMFTLHCGRLFWLENLRGVSYASPIDAKRMLGKSFAFISTGTSGSPLVSARLLPHITIAHPFVCDKCWHIGHMASECKEAHVDFGSQRGRCKLCAEEHPQASACCPYIYQYFNRSTYLLHAAVLAVGEGAYGHDGFVERVFALYQLKPTRHLGADATSSTAHGRSWIPARE
jgi:hypothetical protein